MASAICAMLGSIIGDRVTSRVGSQAPASTPQRYQPTAGNGMRQHHRSGHFASLN
jgi:hypothetical protein